MWTADKSRAFPKARWLQFREMMDGHVGSCTRFPVYQVSRNDARLIDVRSTLNTDDAEEPNVARAEPIRDCRLVCVQSIGAPAAAKVVGAGVHPVKLKPAAHHGCATALAGHGDGRGVRIPGALHGRWADVIDAALHICDRHADYPFAWYFHLVANKGVDRGVANHMGHDLAAGYDYLPQQDAVVLRGWLD